MDAATYRIYKFSTAENVLKFEGTINDEDFPIPFVSQVREANLSAGERIGLRNPWFYVERIA